MTDEGEESSPRTPSAAARDGDGSLGGAQRDARALAPQSLLWRYFGDRRTILIAGRTGTVENMYPQLGQAVSDHSVIFTSLSERVKRSLPPIRRVVYGENPATTGVQVRNFHKTLTGTMADGSKFDGQPYKALDPETFYWAHATFVDMVFTTVERFIKPLSEAEREQLFQECRDWYSLYGMDDTGTPQSYAEFREYWARVVRDDLVGHTKVAQYTIGYIKKGITRAVPKPKEVPAVVWTKVLAPAVDGAFAFLGAGGLDDDLRAVLGVTWSARQDRNYQRFCRVVRITGAIWERVAPLRWRYEDIAVAAFEREGIDPRRTTLRTTTAVRT